MRKALVPTDGSAPARRAVRHIVELALLHPSIEAVLLHVQTGVGALEEQPGDNSVLRDGGEALAAADLHCTSVLATGPAAETITRVAREYGCDAIVMGTRGLSAFSSVWLGSVSSGVLHLSDLPVTLIR